MKLLLVAIHIEPSARAVPLGPAMLAAMLERELPSALDVEIVDLYLEQSAAECAEQIRCAAPNCVGFSVYMWNRDLTVEIVRELRATDPEMILFAGGPEVSLGGAHDVAGAVDFVLPGECEECIVPTMQHLLAGGLPQDLVVPASGKPVEDLSRLPSPFLEKTLDPRDYEGVLWELSRGCPFKCDFCYESRGHSGIRRFPMDRIAAELRLFSEADVDEVFVLDPTFNFDMERAKDVLRLIGEIAPEIHFDFEVRSESIDEELAALFASIDCSLQIGLQSVSNAVLKNVNRTVDPEDFEKKVFLLHEAGAVYGFDLIYGLPGDSFDGFCASLDFVMGFIPNHVDIFPLAVLPGTRLQETAPSFDLEYQSTAPYQVTGSPEFSAADMARAAEMAGAFDTFYNRGEAVPWFDMVLQALGWTPSLFVRRLVEWLKTHKSFESSVELQRQFVVAMLTQEGMESLSTLATDIVTYFGTFEALTEEETMVSFSHNPIALLDLLSEGVTDLDTLALLLPDAPCSASLNIQDGVPSILIHECPQ